MIKLISEDWVDDIVKQVKDDMKTTFRGGDSVAILAGDYAGYFGKIVTTSYKNNIGWRFRVYILFYPDGTRTSAFDKIDTHVWVSEDDLAHAILPRLGSPDKPKII